MPQEVTVGDKKYTFPDEATEEQIIAFVQQDQSVAPQQDIAAPIDQPPVGMIQPGNYPDVPQMDAQGQVMIPPGPGAPELSMGQQLAGAGEVGLTMASGATTGAVNYSTQMLQELARQILSGNFGTTEAANVVEQAALGGMQRGTYQPQTEAGQGQLEAMTPALAAIPPVAGVGPSGLAAMSQGARNIVPGAQMAAQGSRQVASNIIGERGTGQGIMGRLPATGEVMDRSVGAAQTPAALQRRTVAEGMPVPFEGDTGLTLGQATRDPFQLKFEKETAKVEDGRPLLDRVENQSQRFIDNFDALIDLNSPIAREVIDIGASVDGALVTKANVMRKKIQDAYLAARDAGEMAEPVITTPLVRTLQELGPQKGLAPIIEAVEKEALRLGVVTMDESGGLQPVQAPLNETELLRQFVNQNTNWVEPNQARVAKIINGSIDSATEGAGGEMYKAARNLRTKYSTEFENSGLTAKLLGTKGKTSERRIALENVFQEVILKSSLPEINKLRSTLLKAGPKGQQAWKDLKAQTVRYIQENSQSASQRNSRDKPLLSVDALQKTIATLDRNGKLEGLFGKKQAQVIRDLGELATQIYTAPPGMVNHSNTSSAIYAVLSDVATMTMTGVPLPAITVIQQSLKYVKDKELKDRINEALRNK